MNNIEYYRVRETDVIPFKNEKVSLARIRLIIIRQIQKKAIPDHVKLEAYSDCMSEVPFLIERAKESNSECVTNNIYGYVSVCASRIIAKRINENRVIRGNKSVGVFRSFKLTQLIRYNDKGERIEIEDSSYGNLNETIDRERLRYFVRNSLKKLSREEKEIVKDKFMLEETKTYRQIAKNLPYSHETARKIAMKALDKVKEELKKQRFTEF